MVYPIFKVKKPGLYASIQDEGRKGYQRYGVPISGAMDRYAFRMGNYILQNSSNVPALEVTLLGTELIALADIVVSITGADLTPSVDGKTVPMWKSFKIYKGQNISFGQPKSGARAYLCVAGGFDYQSILGSCSVYERGNMGRPLQKDNILYGKKNEKSHPGMALNPLWIPTYKNEIELRVVPSHHIDKFKEESLRLFYEQVYIFQKGDRMGGILKGEELIIHRNGADIISEATTFGTIQIPASGQPIILFADSQTTGGYTTIGTVVSADLWKIAQLLPGGKVRFKKVTLEEAEIARKEWMA
ncbi:biotin-dependent carboxyltransferase family protein [Bacillaceae bacterium S4-13-58]